MTFRQALLAARNRGSAAHGASLDEELLEAARKHRDAVAASTKWLNKAIPEEVEKHYAAGKTDADLMVLEIPSNLPPNAVREAAERYEEVLHAEVNSEASPSTLSLRITTT